ncbi:uncharacterized protein LOC110445515 [Mizuhopecten yessoensis]|uniref:Uncharacterized protein n=1 Tax=Mizuhopecten yessoensis TaxID=6573 RepID=A0A210QYV1_MIZYE|nr:uncharacterized protein LOC110445515 [Mizuhopecten yessoensis]OWF53948.1 hypothetical protein KP79_PYT15373 [Mizuhopecten yessoensis]
MLYLKEALVYLAVLIAVTSSQATYGRKRPAKYLPPRRSYNPVKEVVKTYNPVKEVVKKAIHPKHTSKFPVVDPLSAILPDERPVDGGFFPDPLLERIGRIGDQRRPVRDGEIRRRPGDFNPRLSRGNDRGNGAGILIDPLDRRGSDSWVDRSRSRNQFPSSADRVGDSWGPSDVPRDPWVGRDASQWTDNSGPRSQFPRNNGGSLERRSSLPGFIDESRLRDWNTREQDVGSILDRSVDRSIGRDVLPNGNRNTGLRDLNPDMTRLLRSRLRDTVSNARTDRGFQNRESLPRGRRGEFLPNLQERQNW